MARTMTIDLGDELREFVESLVASGDYRTQSEVVRDSLRLLREKQAASKLENLRRLIQEGMGSGEPIPWDVDDFLRRAKARAGIYEKRNSDNTESE
ncbi:type II toxin-antitoxin system ParD family antitoxin [Enterobacter cancerogenus]|uniref:type II toxin-antitoxin system ParD family antitoxin n=1 Tax=Enterobacter cancerogenus TaxID=69218 RepID=UPI0005390830|nr:type II toxin-antitoxin system ParD family antitoxin [Enterobacter cancerogenus]KGT89072.1 CopG family transcriptional regulator [Enterobacter cancerogenus]